MKHTLTLLTGLLIAPLAALHAADGPKPARPNIIFILADDLGWGDLHCYGNSLIRTPNLDQLSRDGTLFTQFYVNASVCSPSRCGFMTGQFPARHRIYTAIGGDVEKNKARNLADWLDPKVPTLTSVLKGAGYATGHFGKWHLGTARSAPSPSAYGVDDHRTFCSAPGLPGWTLTDDKFWPESSTLIVDEAVRFIRANRDKPFFVNTWLLIPHAPLNPTEEQMKPYADRDWGHGVPHRNAQTIYFASVTDLDTQVGRLIGELEKLGLRENTLILFSSDNGPEVMQITSAGHAAAGSAGPFRGRKRSLYEGGVREPFIACWPGRVPSGRVENKSILSGVDLLPTICKLTGIEIPAGHATDGEDVSDILFGASRERSKPLYWEWRYTISGEPFHRSPMLAIREGDWKLLMNPDGSRIELYDIPHDPAELANLADRQPAIVDRLSGQLLAWKKSLPPGPNDPAAGKNIYPWPASNPPPKQQSLRNQMQ
jgi:N-acetylgalactosamine-6-sulfatase